MSAKERRRRLQQPPPVNVKVAFGGEDDKDEEQNNREILEENTPIITNQVADKNSGDVDSDKFYERAFFTINNTTVEVVLENDILSWTTVIGEIPFDDPSRRKSTSRDNTASVNLNDVFAVSPIHMPGTWSMNLKENIAGTTVYTVNSITTPGVPSSSPLAPNTILRGFQLHSYQTLPDNVLQEILIIFQSNDSNLIEHWYLLLSRLISEYRPSKHILVVCNPYSGPKHSRHIYNTKVRSMLEKAQYKITYTEINDQYNADELFENFEEDFDSIDSLVIMGGDGSVINVINALIRYIAKANRTRLDMENELPTMPFPLCIVPDGTTNIICHTIQGNTDHCTPIIHLLFNKQMKIDMSAIFDIDCNFVTANFSSGAGYPSTVLQYFPRYSLHSPKTVIKKSFSKAASKKNVARPIEMEIRYIPANQTNPPWTRCFQGCPSCTPVATEKSDDQVKAYDESHIQKISKRKKSLSSNTDSNNRLSSAGKTSNQYKEKEKNWKTLHQEYLQVAVLTNASLWSYAPQGLSKYGHLADGFLDLVLIRPTTRKEFLRYIKRNGNSKNQYDLAFTSLIKVKEIEIELKLPLENYLNEITNNDDQLNSSLSDNSSNEDMSDNENKSSGLQRHQPHPPSAPISEDNRRNRRIRQRINEQTQEAPQHKLQSSKSIDGTVVHSKKRQQQQSENEMDSPQIDPYGSTTSLRRGSFFRSSKSKKDKITLPRPSSARGGEPDDEKQQKKGRRSVGGNLRPARSLLNLLSGGKADKSSTNLSRDSFSAGTGRRLSVMSRSSSVDNGKTSDVTDTSRKKRPCMWNLDFSPYNSPLIRIKCFYRYLPVYGVGISPDTKIKEVNYSCFGRIG